MWYYEEDSLEVLSTGCCEVACGLEKNIKELNALPEISQVIKKILVTSNIMYTYDTILEYKYLLLASNAQRQIL